MSKIVTVTVPATTANLGPGFDCIGAALTLYNQFQFSLSDSPLVSEAEMLKITVQGLEADRVKTDPSNLAYQAFRKLYEHLEQTPPPIQIKINLGIPLARGLGSSATAIVGGLVAANHLAGTPLTISEVMQLAIDMEGHPDNVVPALLGGCRLAATQVGEAASHWAICDIPWHPNLVPVVAIPPFELSTAEARQVLPTHYSRSDAIFNTAHLGLLIRALETGHGDWLKAALQDKIHQPYRQSLILGYEAVQTAALAAGAYGMVISGAGPTLLALTDITIAPNVVAAITDAWHHPEIAADVKILSIDLQGAICQVEKD